MIQLFRRFVSCAVCLCCLTICVVASGQDVGKQSSTSSNFQKVDWQLVTEHAQWKPRDSSGEIVFGGKLWLLGGWFDSFAAPPRDVYCSSDGKQWDLVTDNAPWRYSDLPMTASFKNKMWIMGGWTNGRLPGHGACSEVWSSTDGRSWSLETPGAGWSARLAAGVTVFKDRMWIIGGTENYYFGDEKSLKNDVWSTDDGVHWECACSEAPWSPRAYLQSVAFANKLWVFGGGNYVPQYHANNDVWCSEDGKSWTKVTDHAPWSPRLWFSAEVYRDRMWVLGGWSNNPSTNWGDVWYSSDGAEWFELKSDVKWKARHEHSSYVFDDKLWIAGGHAQPLSNEVWSLQLPTEKKH